MDSIKSLSAGLDCLAISITLILTFQLAAGQQQAPVDAEPRKILIPNLPSNHYRFWLKNHPLALKNFEELCTKISASEVKNLDNFRELHSNFSFEDQKYMTDLDYGKTILNEICSNISLVRKSCWGYENNCDIIYLMPECNHPRLDSQGEQKKKIEWFTQADFGWILDRRRELMKCCAPYKDLNQSIISSLECTKYFRTCRGDNLYVQSEETSKTSLQQGPPIILKQVGGWNCDLQPKRIQEEGSERDFLKSWFNELKDYNRIDDVRSEESIEKVEKLVYFIKLDSSARMYDYFRNFLNLYATMHLNNRFTEDNLLVLWDSELPTSPFEDMWKVFSKNKPKSIGQFVGKRVVFKKFIFALPPEIEYGLYSRTPLVSECSKSGLIDAFNKHVIHKLGIEQDRELVTNEDAHIRVTIVSRSHERRILNEQDLKDAAEGVSKQVRVQIMNYTNMTFLDQLKVTHNTDILVGVHGSELTHTLFLPDWAALFELYDCKNARFRDMARLRGVRYFTLKDEPSIVKKIKSILPESAGEKTMNFELNKDEFVSVLKKVIHEVSNRRKAKLGLVSSIRREAKKPKIQKSRTVPTETERPAQSHSEL